MKCELILSETGKGSMASAEDKKWLATSRRAASAKPWDAKPLDENHFVRKTKQAVAKAKSTLDLSEPRSASRWRGRNFATISRRTSEKTKVEDAHKRTEHVKERIDRYDSTTERRKDRFDVAANPVLIQRRTRDASHSKVTEWKPQKSTIALTRQDSLDADIWSLKPPWVTTSWHPMQYRGMTCIAPLPGWQN